jgi:3-oxoacyl-[acyl-carrier-protein] synthase II
MPLNRVVITGYGAISPFGQGVGNLMSGLRSGSSAVKQVAGLDRIGGMRSLVAALVPEVDGKSIPRKYRRAMSAMSIYATLAAEEALACAGIVPAQLVVGELGICLGSTVGSTQTSEEFFRDYLSDHSLERLKSTLFFQIMNHSCAANVAQALELTGRVLSPAAACATGCQVVGLGYELIAAGRETMMLCGGADEFHPLTAATFDIMNAASTGFNDHPALTPRPFDERRDGVVCAEGAGVLLLESLSSAQQRQVPILAEVCGFATTADPGSIANPDAAAMARCMELALADAQLAAAEIEYLNAHATGTIRGDVAESAAIEKIFGRQVAVSSLKGHLGHTMAASGALELIASLEMMAGKIVIPTLNLEAPDPDCAQLRWVRELESWAPQKIVKNSFALGGVNSSLVVRSFA